MSIKNIQLIRFLGVGVTALCVEYSAFYVLLSVLDWSLLLANSLSFGVGLLISFALNRMWAFNDSDGYKHKMRHQFVSYGLLALINLLISNALISALNALDVSPLVGKIIAIGAIAVWNFLIYKYVIFSSKNSKRS